MIFTLIDFIYSSYTTISQILYQKLENTFKGFSKSHGAHANVVLSWQVMPKFWHLGISGYKASPKENVS